MNTATHMVKSSMMVATRITLENAHHDEAKSTKALVVMLISSTFLDLKVF